MREINLNDEYKGFDEQKPAVYSENALSGLYKLYGLTYKDGRKINTTRFKDLNVGDKLYSTDNKKLIEYTIVDITEEQVHFYYKSDYIRYRGNEPEYGIYTIVRYTYKNSQGRKNSFEMFKDELRNDRWDGLAPEYRGFPSLDDIARMKKEGWDHMLYPNDCEVATNKKIFASKEAVLGYLYDLRNDRMYDVRELQKEIDLKLSYANEYVPLMRELGWKGNERE